MKSLASTITTYMWLVDYIEPRALNVAKRMESPKPVVIDGVLWKPYSVNHIDADGKKFSFYIFAISREHAACVVDDIRETAWLGDEIVG